jgi:hypothetical protein
MTMKTGYSRNVSWSRLFQKRILVKVIPETYLVKVIPETYLVKVNI